VALTRHEEHLLVGLGGLAAGVAVGGVAAWYASEARLRSLARSRTLIVNVPTLQALLALPGSEQVVQSRIDQPRAIVIPNGQPVTPALQLAPAARVGLVYRDATKLIGDVQGGVLNRNVLWLFWDYEDWSYTPQDQQINSGAYCEAAAGVCHNAGLKFAAAPSPGITQTILGEQLSILDQYQRFLDLGLAGAAARYADAVVAQAQLLEGNPSHYVSWVRRFALQARLANPRVQVWTVLSASPSGQAYAPTTLYQELLSVAAIVDGYWLFVPLRVAEGTPPSSSLQAAVQEQATFSLLSMLASL
jgi:hypothetical protein